MEEKYLLPSLELVEAVFTDSECAENGKLVRSLVKDLNNALDCAHTVGAPVPMTAQVQEIMQWMHNHEGGQKDHSAIAQYYEFLTGEKIGQE